MAQPAKTPASGLWYGMTAPVTLSRQGSCGERVEARSGKMEPFWAVLFFDEDSVCGHATQAGRRLSLHGWWGSAEHLRPAVTDLAETELWETGELGLHLTLRHGKVEESVFGWVQGDRIVGYRRHQGG